MKSLEQELREGNYDIDDVLNDETGERRVLLARMGRDVEAVARALEPDVLVTLIENGYAEDYYDDWSDHISSSVRKALASIAMRQSALMAHVYCGKLLQTNSPATNNQKHLTFCPSTNGLSN